MAAELQHGHVPFLNVGVRLGLVVLQVEGPDWRGTRRQMNSGRPLNSLATAGNRRGYHSLLANMSTGEPSGSSHGQPLNCQAGPCTNTATTRSLRGERFARFIADAAEFSTCPPRASRIETLTSPAAPVSAAGR